MQSTHHPLPEAGRCMYALNPSRFPSTTLVISLDHFRHSGSLQLIRDSDAGEDKLCDRDLTIDSH